MRSACRPILLLALTAAVTAPVASGAATALPRATLMSVKGLVKLRPPAGSWRPATLPQDRRLWTGDELQTHQHAQARVGLDGATLELGPLTHIVIPGAPAQRPGMRTLLQVVKGKLLILLMGARPVEIGTAGATASARGTKFVVDVDEAGLTVLTVLEGSVDFHNALGTVLVSAGEQSTAGPGQAPSRPMRADPSTALDWEASPDSIWLGFEKLYRPELTPEQRGALLPDAETAALRNPAARPLVPEYTAWGDLLHDSGRDAEAATAYRQAIAMGASDALRLRLAFALLAQGHNAEAAALFTQAAQTPSCKGMAIAGQAIAALGTGASAVSLADQALQAAPQEAEVAVMAGFVYLRAGTVLQARKALEQALQLAPRDYRAKAYLALAKLTLSDGAAACAVAAAPGSGLAHEALGATAFYAGSLAQAAAEAATAVELAPDGATAHLLAAQVAAADGDLARALHETELAVTLDPNLPQAYQMLGVLSLAMNDVARAEKAFRLALERQPTLASAQAGLGQALARQDKFAAALAAQQAAISLDPGAAGAHNNLGAVYMQTGQFTNALAEFDQALALQPNWALVHGNRALTYLEMNEYAQAVQEGERAVKLGARSARVHTTLARVYLKQNRTNKAWAALREALQLDPNYALARMHMAEVYVRLGLDQEASRERLQALARQPSAMVDSRSYGRSEVALAAGGAAMASAGGFTSGRGDGGQNAYHVAGSVVGGDWERDRTDYTDQSALLLFGRQTSPDHTVLLTGSLNADDRDLPGRVLPGGLGLPTDADCQSDFHSGDFAVLARSPLDGVQLTWRGGYRWSKLSDSNPDSLLPDPNPLRRLDLRTHGPVAEVRLDDQLGYGEALVAGVAWYNEKRQISGLLATGNPPGSPTPVTYDAFANDTTRNLLTGYADWERRLSDRIWLLAGGRIALANDASPVVRPRVRLRYKPSAASTVALLTRPLLADDVSELAPVDEWSSRGFMSPLALARGGFCQSYEAQYELQPRDGSLLRVTLFRRDQHSLLVDLQDPAWAVEAAPTVLGRVRLHGVEAEYERWLTDRLSGGLWVRWAESDNRDLPGREVPYQPSLLARARLDYLDEAGWRVALVWQQVGRRYADVANATRLGAYSTLDLTVARQLDLHTEAYMAVENLLDREHEFYQGYPERGRRASVGLRHRF